MRALTVLILLAAGVFLGVMGTVAMLPDVTRADVFASGAAAFEISNSLNSMRGAARGIAIALMWGVFGITIALVVSVVFGAFGRVFSRRR